MSAFDPTSAIKTESFGDQVVSLSIYISLPIMFFTLQITIFSLIFWRYTAKFLAAIFAIISVIAGYFMHTYSAILDSEMMRNAISTDTTELLDLFSPLMLVYLAFLLVCLYVIYKIKLTASPLKSRLLLFFASLIIFSGTFAALSKDLIPFFRTHNSIRFWSLPYYPIYSAIKLAKSYAPKEPFIELTSGAKLNENSQKEVLLLVIGETARSQNLSLNGYSKNDTNIYTKPFDPVSFTDFNSCGTSTAISLPCIFSDLGRDNFSIDKANNRSNLLDIISAARVSVSCFTNNSGSHKGVCARIEDTISLGGKEPDGVLLPLIKDRLNSVATTSLIVAHLQGSHGPSYFRRYPAEFARFTPTCDTTLLKECSNEAIVNTYDNTILYTDFIIAEMIKMLQNSGIKSTLFYTSDHGESLGENGIYLHGIPYALAPKMQTKVPAILWQSDKNELTAAKSLKNANLSHDNIFSTVLGILGVSSPHYDPAMDFLARR